MQSCWQQIDSWYHTAMGHACWAALQHSLAINGQNMRGEFGVQIGPPYSGLMSTMPLQNRVLIDPQTTRLGNYAQIAADVDALPLQSDSVSVIVLAHAMEVASDRIQLLKSCWNALSPEGLLLIVSFNPWSFYGLRRLLGDNCDLPWNLALATPPQLCNWLGQVGFVDIKSSSCGFVWPLRSVTWSRRLRWMESMGYMLYPGCGHYCLITARKRVTQAVKVQSAWQSSRPFQSRQTERTARSILNERQSS